MGTFLRTCVLCGLAFLPSRVVRAEPLTLALIDFQFRDTSGEVADQRSVHSARIEAFMAKLAKDLSANNKYRVVKINCPSCEVVGGNFQKFAAPAHEAGADYMLVGGIQKMSTLVQWAEIALIDVASGRIVLKKLYTFRGDTDEAWQHAEQFIANQIIASAP